MGWEPGPGFATGVSRAGALSRVFSPSARLWWLWTAFGALFCLCLCLCLMALREHYFLDA